MKPLILVIDDNLVNLKLVVYLLKMKGYRVLQAEDAEQGLDIIRGILPDLILLDLGLPKMDGLSLLRLLRANERTRRLRICAFSAHAMKGDVEKALAEGFNGYFTKPIDTRKFSQQIETALSNPL